jgi:hypothetical protein
MPALNRGRCPLTDLAARFTADRARNFDIFLPRWIAQQNKRVFGGRFVAGELVWAWRWSTRSPDGQQPSALQFFDEKMAPPEGDAMLDCYRS